MIVEILDTTNYYRYVELDVARRSPNKHQDLALHIESYTVSMIARPININRSKTRYSLPDILRAMKEQPCSKSDERIVLKSSHIISVQMICED